MYTGSRLKGQKFQLRGHTPHNAITGILAQAGVQAEGGAMSFHGSGLANDPGSVILVFAIAVSLPIIMFISVCILLPICLLGLPIWKARAKWKRSGLSLEQYDKATKQLAAEQLRKAAEEWSLPPELNLPTPRPVRSAPLGTRLLRSLPRLPFLTLLATFIYSLGFLYTPQVTPVARDQSVPSYVFHAFLDFLRAPQWQRWMLWPSVIFGGLAGLTALPGHFDRRKEQRLLKWGKPARAVVTRAISRYSHLEYHDAAGNLVKILVRSNILPQPGEQVLTLLYDPDKPDQYITYPVARYKIGVPENS